MQSGECDIIDSFSDFFSFRDKSAEIDEGLNSMFDSLREDISRMSYENAPGGNCCQCRGFGGTDAKLYRKFERF